MNDNSKSSLFYDEKNKGIHLKRGTQYSCGYDLPSPHDLECIKGNFYSINLNIQINVPPGYYARIASRSSYYSKMDLYRSIYKNKAETRGINTFLTLMTLKFFALSDFNINKGDNIAQVVFYTDTKIIEGPNFTQNYDFDEAFFSIHKPFSLIGNKEGSMTKHKFIMLEPYETVRLGFERKAIFPWTFKRTYKQIPIDCEENFEYFKVFENSENDFWLRENEENKTRYFIVLKNKLNKRLILTGKENSKYFKQTVGNEEDYEVIEISRLCDFLAIKREPLEFRMDHDFNKQKTSIASKFKFSSFSDLDYYSISEANHFTYHYEIYGYGCENIFNGIIDADYPNNPGILFHEPPKPREHGIRDTTLAVMHAFEDCYETLESLFPLMKQTNLITRQGGLGSTGK